MSRILSGHKSAISILPEPKSSAKCSPTALLFRLGSRARGSCSYHTQFLRRVCCDSCCGWSSRGVRWRCLPGIGGRVGDVPIRGGLPGPKIGTAGCGSRTAPSWVSCPNSSCSARLLALSLFSILFRENKNRANLWPTHKKMKKTF